MSKPLKTTMNERLSGITVNPVLAERILSLPQAARRGKRRAMAVLIVCGALLVALSGLATVNPGFQQLASQVGDKIAQMLQPIALVSESNGIRMEVVAAMCDERNAVVYFALQDSEGGERLNGLIDPYSCFLSGMGVGTTSTAPYDKESQTAMLSIFAYGGERMNGKKVTFSLSSFLVGRTTWEDVALGIPLDTVQVAERTVWLARENSSGGGGDFTQFQADDGMKILPPGEMRIPVPGVDFAHISNIGLVDGRLHVQTCFPMKKFTLASPDEMDGHMDDHGGVWLVDKEGQPLPGTDTDLSVSFAVDDQGELCSTGSSIYDVHEGKVHYQEEVFTVDSDLSQYALQGYYVTNKEYITGDWSVTFRLQAVKAYKQAACDIDVGEARIHTVMVSPMGWTLLGEAKSPSSDVSEARIGVLVKLTDGTEQHIEIGSSVSDGINVEFHLFAEEPLDISLIQEAYVNGLPIQFAEKQ